jgi:hypothetical protein
MKFFDIRRCKMAWPEVAEEPHFQSTAKSRL